jgi:hypothetical protein
LKRLAAVLVVAACLGLPAAARADGDPASDYLLAQDLFLPFNVPIDPEKRQELDAAIKSAAAHGFKIRVAIIAHKYDLGAVPQLYGRPQPYAEFLGQELEFVYPGRLLVAMPNGYGYARAGKPDPELAAALSSLPEPGQDGTALTAGATSAIGELAQAAGHPLPELAGTGGGGSNGTLKIAGAAAFAGALALLGVVAVLLLRRRREPSP